MLLSVILLTILFFLYFCYNGKQIKHYIFLGLILIFLHSLLLPLFSDSAFAGSDTLIYYEMSLKLRKKLFNSFNLFDALIEANPKASYWGYCIFNALSICGNNPIISATLIRLNNFIVFLFTLLVILKFLNERNINLNSRWVSTCILSIKLVFLWYSMFNLRDGIILSLTFCYIIFILNKKFFKSFLTIILLFFFRESMALTLILGSAIIVFTKSLKLKLHLTKLVLAISISIYCIWVILPPPSPMIDVFKNLLLISSEDTSNYNELNIEMYKLIDSNPKKVGHYISTRYLKKLPALIFPANPLKKLFMVIIEKKALFSYTPISLILEVIVSLLAFTFVPIMIFLLFQKKIVTSSNEFEFISCIAIFMIFVFLGTYLIKFGYTQLRHSFTIYPLLFFAGTFLDISYTKKLSIIIITYVMFLIMVILFILKPYYPLLEYC